MGTRAISLFILFNLLTNVLSRLACTILFFIQRNIVLVMLPCSSLTISKFSRRLELKGTVSRDGSCSCWNDEYLSAQLTARDGITIFLRLQWFYAKVWKFLAGNTKLRRITYVCTTSLQFSWRLAALNSYESFLYSVWSAGGLWLVKQAHIRCGNRFANPPANRKQARAISLNITSVPHGNKFTNHSIPGFS